VVSSAVTPIANDGYDHLLVLCVASENILKAIGHVEELLLTSNFSLKEFGLDIETRRIFQSQFFVIIR